MDSLLEFVGKNDSGIDFPTLLLLRQRVRSDVGLEVLVDLILLRILDHVVNKDVSRVLELDNIVLA